MKKTILIFLSIFMTMQFTAQIMAQTTKFKTGSEKEFSVSGKKISKLVSSSETTLYFYEIKDKNLIISEVVLDKKEKELQSINITALPLNKIRKEKNSPELIKEENDYFIPKDIFKISFLSNETNVSHFTKTSVELYEDDKQGESKKVTFEFVYFPNEKEAKAFLEEINKNLK